MTITVEDGTLVEDANSYVDEADLLAFATARGITLSTDEEQLLISSMDYIESLNFKGWKYTSTQALQWPREGVYVDGYYIANNVIPQELKNGQMQAAIAIDQGNGPQDDIEPGIKREKVGDLEVEYKDNSPSQIINTKIISALRKLLASGGGGNVLNVVRG